MKIVTITIVGAHSQFIEATSPGRAIGKHSSKVEFPKINEIVTIYGDANSTLASALASSKLKVQIARVEARGGTFKRKC